MNKRWDEGYCPDCGTFLGDEDYLTEHWCPNLVEEDDDELLDEETWEDWQDLEYVLNKPRGQDV